MSRLGPIAAHHGWTKVVVNRAKGAGLTFANRNRERGERAQAGQNQYSTGTATVAVPPKPTAELAASAGMSERTWQTRAKVGSRITPEVARVIDDIDTDTCSLPDSTTQLNYLAGVDNPQDQLEIVTRVADGTARDVWEASKQLKGELTPEPKPHVTNNSGNNEWYTPPEYTEAARRVDVGNFRQTLGCLGGGHKLVGTLPFESPSFTAVVLERRA